MQTPPDAGHVPPPVATWTLLLAVKVALIGPVFPLVASSQPANSNELVAPAENVMPVAGTTGAVPAPPAVAPAVPNPIMTLPPALSIEAIPTLPGFGVVGLDGPGVTKSSVPLMSRIPAAALGCVWLFVIGAPKLTVKTDTPGLIGDEAPPDGFAFVQVMRTLPPPGRSAIPLVPEAPTSVRPISDALVVTPGSAGTAPIALPLEEMAHVTTCALAGLTSVNKRPRNVSGNNNRLITRILLILKSADAQPH